MTGVRDPEEMPESRPDLERPADPWLSPSLTSVLMAFWRSPPTFFNIARFCLSSLNPISRSLIRFDSTSFGPTSAPNSFEGLFRLGGDCERSRELGRCCCCCCNEAVAAASRFAFDDRGKIDEADLKPNRLPVLGGKGGGWSSEFVLPVFCRVCVLIERSWYFCRMNLSMAVSTSSASKGMGGLAFVGL